MTVRQFINIESCPRQRNTELHAKKALASHLSKPSPVHLNVSIAKLPNGRLIKLDGHTRAFLWNAGDLEPLSSNVEVRIYAVKNMKEVTELYEHFDNVNQGKNSADQISGKLREVNWDPKTLFFQKCKFNQVLFCAYDVIYNQGKRSSWAGGDELKYERYRLIEEFLPELKEIDNRLNIVYSKGAVKSGIIAAMIVTQRAVMKKKIGSQELFVKFWSDYITDNGIKTGREKNAVQAYRDYVVEKGAGNTVIYDSCVKGLGYFSGFCENKSYIRAISNIDFAPYLNKK
jgi:hypothetical protein